MIEPTYVTRSYLPSKEAFLKYLEKPWNTALLTNQGELCRELESRLKSYLGVKHLILVNNGSLALHLAYKALGLRGGVITTPFTFAATSSVLFWEGCQPVFCDIDRETFCLSPDKVREKIHSNISGIVPVHVFGNACDVEAFNKIKEENPQIKLIYDAAHAFGVDYLPENCAGRKRSILEFGDASIISFHATKIFHCIEGGAVIVNDEEKEALVRGMMNFGFNGKDGISPLGTNCKLSEFHAAMGLAVLDDIESIMARRQEVVEKYKRELSDRISFQIHNPKSSQNYAYFPILLNDEEELELVVRELNRSNVFPRRYFFPSLDTIKYSTENFCCKNSRNISSRILCLPLFPDLKKEVQQEIIRVINETIGKRNEFF